MNTSDLAALLRLIMYDVIGLVVPGLVFFLGLFKYANTARVLTSVTGHLKADTTANIVAILVVAYVLGYLLQAISYYHFRWLDPLGKRLLDKPVTSLSTKDYGVSSAGRFTRTYFEGSEFFKFARSKIGKAIGLIDPGSLTYSDIENLSFSIASDAGDKARHFRFRSDLCGAMATGALGHAICAIPLWATTARVPYRWWAVPVLIIGWIWGLRTYTAHSTKTRTLSHVVYWIAPTVIMTVCIVWRLTMAHPSWWWTIPAAVSIWFFFMSRSFFYGDIGGRIVFYIAVAELSKPQGGDGQSREQSNRGEIRANSGSGTGPT